MAFTALKTVLRNSPSHLILDLSRLPSQSCDQVTEGLSLESALQTLELILPEEGCSDDQYLDLRESLVQRSRVRSVTISSPYDDEDDEDDEDDGYAVWDCPVNNFLALILDCVALEELELKGMQVTSSCMTSLDNRLRRLPKRHIALKQLKLGQCHVDKGELATLARLLTKVSPSLHVVHLPIRLGSLKPNGVVDFVTHISQLPQLQSLKLTGTKGTVRSLKADLLVKLADECPVLHEVSGVWFSRATQKSKVSLEHLLQLNRYGRRWVDCPTFPRALWAKVLTKAARDGAHDACRFLLLRRAANLVGRGPQQQGRTRPPPSSSCTEPPSAKRVVTPRGISTA